MLDEDVYRLRKQIKMLYRRMQREQPAVEGLSPTTLQLLVAVERSATPMRPGQLAAELQMTNSNVAAALRLLEGQGLVVLISDPDDGRKAFVRLTKQASKVVAEIRESHNVWLKETAERALTEKEQRLLIQAGDLMQRLADDAATSTSFASLSPRKTRRSQAR